MVPDSPEWIAAIKADIGIRDAVQQQQPQKRAGVAAPSSRSTPGVNGSRTSGPRVLTYKQAQAAKDMDMTNDEYWNYLQDCIADGTINLPRDTY